MNVLVFRAQEPKAPVTYCPVPVHPSSKFHYTFSTSRTAPWILMKLGITIYMLTFQNRSVDFDETWYGWSTQGPLLFFGQIRPGADPGRGKNWSRGSPSLKMFFFRPGDYSIKSNAKQWSRSIWEVLLFLVSFESQIFAVFLDLVIMVYCNAISIYFYAAKSFILINFV